MVVWSASMALGGALALGFLPTASRAYEYQNVKEGGWAIAVQRDAFANRIHCRLRASNGELRYKPGAIGFRIRHRDTLNAWYRVDDGVPVRWQDRTAALIALGASIDGPSLDNPTGGWVWIPVTEVHDAQQVSIRAGDHGHIRHFPLRGLASALETAGHLGCSSDASFEN